jgi:transglutaminase-like putative cysteine protease
MSCPPNTTSADRRAQLAHAARNYIAALEALFRWVRDHIRYRRDPATLQGVPLSESLSAPTSTLARGEEDCDGKATLLAALVRALGHPARLLFRAIGGNPAKPHAFTHVYLVARIGDREIPLDATYRGTAFGWEYPSATRRMEYAL